MGLADDLEAMRQRQTGLAKANANNDDEQRHRNWNEMNSLVQEFIPLARKKNVKTVGLFKKIWRLPTLRTSYFGTYVAVEPSGKWQFFDKIDGPTSVYITWYGSSDGGPPQCSSDPELVEKLRQILLSELT